MLRFAQPTAAPCSPVRWSLWPDGRRLWYPELCAVLEAMPKPLLISAHVEHGGITVSPLAGAALQAKARLEHEFRNHGAYLREKVARLRPGSEPAGVLVELEDDEFIVSTSDLAVWAEEYLVTSCGWTLADNGGDARAPLRMLLVRPDGTSSPGWACAHPAADA